MQGGVQTGFIDVNFTGIDNISSQGNTSGSYIDLVERDEESASFSAHVKIDPFDDKRITVSVDNAYPGDVLQVKFFVRNNGQVPVIAELENVNLNKLAIIYERPVPQLDPHTVDYGIIKFIVCDSAEKNQEVNFNVPLIFKQWNLN